VNVVEFQELEKNPKFKEQFRRVRLLNHPELRQARWLQLTVASVLTALNGDAEGAGILDIGCGSSDPEVRENHYRRKSGYFFEPRAARVLHDLGARVIGVDRGSSQEEYDHRQSDIKDSLPITADDNIQVAYCNLLYDSPDLDLRLRHTLGSSFPDIVHNHITAQLTRVLGPNATYIHDLSAAKQRIENNNQHKTNYHTTDCHTCSLDQRPLGRLLAIR
jgi:hypothetical protein